MGKILHFIAKETQGECFTSRMSNNTFIDTTFDNLSEIIIIEHRSFVCIMPTLSADALPLY